MGVERIGPPQASFSGDAVKITSYGDDFTVQGGAFTFEKNIAIASGATKYILFDYTTFTPDPNTQIGQVYVFPPQFSTTSGPVDVDVYRGTNYTGGTEFDAINPNTLAPKTTSETTLTLDPTGTVKGTLSLEYLVGTQGQGSASGGGSNNGLSFFIRGNVQKTLVEIVNRSGNAITFHYAQTFFEI
jgi:hypothetical protein